MTNFGTSKLWEHLAETIFKDALLTENFRSTQNFSNRLSMWDPHANSIRYYKTLLLENILNASDLFHDIYYNIKNNNLGSPLHVTYNNINYNLEYIISSYEVEFLSQILGGIHTICEIGAGLGRTCHAILNNSPNINEYTIIDIPVCLKLSKEYLKSVLDLELYSKIKFVTNKKANNIKYHDLFINIDSFAEMDPFVIKNYMNLISKNGKYFYSKNPLGKYNLSSIGKQKPAVNPSYDIMKFGLCKDIIDIFNYDEITKSIPNYLKQYCPTEFKLISHKVTTPFHYYYQALYIKNLSQK